ncbi:MBL fold metallo-hydrolase [Parashewanella curva]|uniref:MBL fold metallo-hydrolase n=1 Tax=Parashewanella curva TaxID=2338552 RepID=A0A3L8Q2V9_9GAMM|nr:MBL fold metallo-hydrolase [Parashewanella curva]RLV61399.1 MBL fold metallo-hydrolase [Parashewanella curva]
MDVIHHGAKDGVTGSCHELVLDFSCSVLIDCGLFQGNESRDLTIEFDVSNIKALVVTHCHVDHIGRIPWLLAAGFRGPIYCTQASAALLPIVLEDALKVHFSSRRMFDAIKPLLSKQIVPVNYNVKQVVPLNSDLPFSIRFQQAGHILGSAYVECFLPNGEVGVFSGDLGPSNTPLLPDPIPPKFADWLVIESTYGSKVHEDIASRRVRLKQVLEKSLQDGGAILIPAFSIGRTQELLFDLEQLIYELPKSEVARIPVVLDSPLANKFTESYREFRSLWSKEAKEKIINGRHPLDFEQLVTINSHKKHLALVNRIKHSAEPVIVIAASGMLTGGRIVDYMKALLADERTDVLLVGYQAKGTPGRDLFKGRPIVEFNDESVEVKAQIHKLNGYSAHADANELTDFVSKIDGLKKVRLIHGEPKSQLKLKERLLEVLSNVDIELACEVPNIMN